VVQQDGRVRDRARFARPRHGDARGAAHPRRPQQRR
jgi:hypothetical protein